MSAARPPAAFRLRLNGRSAGAGAIPDPIEESEYYEGVLPRRIVAYFVDLIAIGLIYALAVFVGFIVKVATFFLLAPLVALLLAMPLIGIAYHVFSVGGRMAATPGMRLLGLQLRCMDGSSPSRLHALVQIVMFYITVPATGGLILLFVLFNRYHRTIHDLLSQTVMLRRLPQGTATAARPARA